MTLIIKGWKAWLVILLLAFALLGAAQVAYIIVVARAEHAKYGVRLTREWDQKWKQVKISYAQDEEGRKWRLVK